MRILRAIDYKRMPWKNGGGETAEIAVSPKDAGLADFDWRISMATVASDGPFSAFADVDRTLTILCGEGMALDIAGKHLTLTPSSAPHAFPADVATSATLLGGTVVDLNVMTRRGHYIHVVEKLALPYLGKRNEATEFVFCTSGTVVLELESGQVELNRFDCAAIPVESTLLSVSGSGSAIRIEIQLA